jgi:hypothetical protein
MIRKLTDTYNGITVEEHLLNLSKKGKLFNESFPRTATFQMIRYLINKNYVICQSIPAMYDGSIVKYLITVKGIARINELHTIRTKNKEEVEK